MIIDPTSFSLFPSSEKPSSQPESRDNSSLHNPLTTSGNDQRRMAASENLRVSAQKPGSLPTVRASYGKPRPAAPTAPCWSRRSGKRIEVSLRKDASWESVGCAKGPQKQSGLRTEPASEQAPQRQADRGERSAYGTNKETAFSLLYRAELTGAAVSQHSPGCSGPGR